MKTKTRIDPDGMPRVAVQMINTLLTDPPWLERGGGKIKRGADRHYVLMSVKDILVTLQQSKQLETIGPDAHCYMFVTNNFLRDGLWLMAELGFRYVTNICWVKVKDNWPRSMMDLATKGDLYLTPETWQQALDDALRIGLGQYFRGSHELCLFGVRGKCQKPAKALPSAFMAPRGRHSAKPERIYQIIEQSSPGPYLELFARSKRPGWTSWGNEVD